MNGHNAVARRWSRSSGQPGSWPAASCWSKPISWPTVTSHLQPPVPRGDPSSPPSMAPAALRARVAGVLVCSSWCPDAITGVDAVPAPTSSAFPSMPFPPPALSGQLAVVPMFHSHWRWCMCSPVPHARSPSRHDRSGGRRALPRPGRRRVPGPGRA